ncbi:hypothetical protein BJX96DRAFT_54253 [Aspergillus floccosus]
MPTGPMTQDCALLLSILQYLKAVPQPRTLIPSRRAISDPPTNRRTTQNTKPICLFRQYRTTSSPRHPFESDAHTLSSRDGLPSISLDPNAGDMRCPSLGSQRTRLSCLVRSAAESGEAARSNDPLCLCKGMCIPVATELPGIFSAGGSHGGYFKPMSSFV